MRWEAVNARARGLGTHLLDRRALEALVGAAGWADFVGRVAARGISVGAMAALDLDGFDRAMSAEASRRLALLGRWLALGPGSAALAVILEDEERRALRALLRGAAQGAPPSARVRAALPTPGLPARALVRLADAESVPALAQELVRLGHPAGRRLQQAIRVRGAPDLRSLEWALARLFAERAARAARRGGPVVRRHAAALVEEQNVWTLLVGGAPAISTPPVDEYLPGGERLPRTRFDRLREERDGDVLRLTLAAELAGTPMGSALAMEPFEAGLLESRAAAARLAWLRALARRDPLGGAVTLHVMERIRWEARALRGLAWGVALGAPPSALAPLLGEAA